MGRRWIDILRDGAQPADLRVGYDLGVSRLLGVTALSALNRGYTQSRWEAEVFDPRSRLGSQVRVNRRGKLRTETAVRTALDSAWRRAKRQADRSPKYTTETARIEAAARADAIRTLVHGVGQTGGRSRGGLNEQDRAVLLYAADRAESTGSTRVNLPQAATAQAVGLTPRQVRRTLERLEDRLLLMCRERGRSSAEASRRRSSAYDVPDGKTIAAYLGRETRQVRPPALTDAPLGPDGVKPVALTDAPLDPRGAVPDDFAREYERLVAELGVERLAALLEGHRVARCQRAEPHGPHDYGPMTSNGRLAHRCSGFGIS